jgi:hypothetical protein
MNEITLLIIIFIFIIFILYITISWLFAQISGWNELSSEYPSFEDIEGIDWHYQSVTMKMVSFGFTVNICSNIEGINVSMISLFRLINRNSLGIWPDIFIPWKEITTKDIKQLNSSYVEIRVYKKPLIPIVISKRLASQINQASNNELEKHLSITK